MSYCLCTVHFKSCRVLNISEINSRQTLWKATRYEMFETSTVADRQRMAGGRRSAKAFPTCATVTKKQLAGTLSFAIFPCISLAAMAL